MRLAIKLREIRESDINACATLFQETIHKINAKDYTPPQLNAWAPLGEPINKDNYPRWLTLLKNIAFIAEYENRIVGFGDITDQGYLDRLFVHKDFQGQGVATAILKRLEQETKQLNLKKITTAASITAKPFFESAGFTVVKEQSVEVRGENLTNYVMEKILSQQNGIVS